MFYQNVRKYVIIFFAFIPSLRKLGVLQAIINYTQPKDRGILIFAQRFTLILGLKAKVFSLIIIAFAVFSLLFLFQDANEKSVPQGQVVSNTSPGSPVRLTIPAINVNADIQYVGVTSEGEMEIPDNTVDVGWFRLGSRPGEKGSAVISGHLDGENGETGVFTDLNKLKEGDKLYVEDGKGTSIAFIVRESRIYDPGYAEEVFSLNDSAHLNLITCDGVWDGTKKSYSKRLVIFTDILQQS